MFQLILNKKGQKVNYWLYFTHQHMVSIAILINNSNKHECLSKISFQRTEMLGQKLPCLPGIGR